MPKLKRLLVSACFETAQQRRHCSRNQEHVICQDDKCLLSKENMAKHNYCMECAALILRKARQDLAQLMGELEPGEQRGRIDAMTPRSTLASGRLRREEPPAGSAKGRKANS